MDIKKIKQSFIRQNDQSDCGVACLLSLINYYDGTNTLEKLREHSGTTKQGTTLLGLYQAANQTGFDAEGNKADIKSLIEHGEPLILHVLMDQRLQHFVVCYGYEENHFIIGDPGKGIQYYTKKDLGKIWDSKTCLTLKPNQQFVKAKSVKHAKKDWIYKLVKEDFNLLGLSIMLGLIVAVLSMAMAVFSQKLIDDIIPSKNLQKLFLGIGLLTLLLLIRIGLMVLRQFFLITQSKNFNNRIINFFYGSLLFLPKSFFDTRRIGELVARLNDTTRIQRVITEIAGSVIIDSLMVIISLSFIFIYTWEAGIIATVTLPFYFLLIYRFNNKIITSQKEVMVAYAHSESNYINTMQGVAVIKNLNKQSLFQKINKIIYGNLQDKVFELGKINIHLGFISGFFGILILISILGYTSYMVFEGLLQLGELMAVLGIASTLIPSITNLALIVIPVNEAKVAFNRMFEFVKINPETDEKTNNPILFESLEVKNLSFRFPGRKQLLRKIDFEVQKNELIAIVGESGCGKTTIGQILEKFYLPENGEIIINKNLSLSDINTNDWRTILGVVPQNIHIFNGNVLDNICMGETGKDVEKIITFCKTHEFHTFFEKFPQGYLTILGEEGINLSGGQIQLIGLARALYKMPQLLILDEATAAMDRNTENFIFRLLNHLKSKMGIIFISHRLHILKKLSDRIYVIDDGIIKAKGNHNHILKSENIYSEFWKEFVYN